MFQTFITRHNSNFFSDFFFQAEDGIRYYKVTGVQTCAFFFQAEDGIRDYKVTGVQTCALPICSPIGRHYGRGGPQNAGDIEVIGVVEDVKYNSLEEDPQPGDYLPYTQNVR